MERLKRTQLHNYQMRAVDFIKSHPASALFLDMGLGKTVTTLTAISDLIDECEVNKVLVIAPKKVAEATWAQEAEHWSHLAHLETSVVLGDAKRRQDALARKADVYITSRDLFVWVLTYMQEHGGFDFDMVVLDELTAFKRSESQRFKAFKKIRPHIARVVGLTGTPAPNGLKDLWAQMYCVDMGESLGRSKTRFINEYFSVFQRGYVIYKMTPKAGAAKAITEAIRPRVLTMKAEDYLELPDAIEMTMPVVLSPQVMSRYREFERDCVLDFKKASEDQPQHIIATNAAALCGKLQQYANGAVYTDNHEPVEMHQEKIDALVELIESAHETGEPVLVFYQFQHDLGRIARRKELQGMIIRKYEDERDLKEWNEGKIDVMLTHAASTAYGLNLQQGGHIIVWFGTGWNAELYLQGNARLHRQGQQHTTRIYRLVAAGTMDEDACNAIVQKVNGQEAMLQALKERIARYR